MLAATSRSVTAYCQRHDFRYEAYVGLKRGYFGWHASFNRIYILRELIDRGYRGWAVYMDADAFVADFDFDLRGFLADKDRYAGIFTPSGVTGEYWDINNGIFLINLASPVAHKIVSDWYDLFQIVTDEQLRNAPDWTNDFLDDQGILQKIFREWPAVKDDLFYVSHRIINSIEASFLKQFMRGHEPDLGKRIRSIETMIQELLSAALGLHQPPAPFSKEESAEIVVGAYQGVLNRAPDPLGIETYVPHVAAQGRADGVAFVVESLLASDEFKARRP
ncbi:hypothetical protein [Zavarzinia compransoris]|nr:hypothetical protein [Zavarzinia compransoris]